MCLSIWMSAWRVKKPSHFLVSYYPIGTGSKPTDHISNAPCYSSSAAALGAARRTVARGTPGDCAGSTETERGGVSEYHRLCCPNNGCMNYSAHTTFDHVYLDCRVLRILSIDGASFLGQNYSVKVYFIVKVMPEYLTCQFFINHIFSETCSVTRCWEFSQFLGFWNNCWDDFSVYGKFPKPSKVWEFWYLQQKWAF